MKGFEIDGEFWVDAKNLLEQYPDWTTQHLYLLRKRHGIRFKRINQNYYLYHLEDFKVAHMLLKHRRQNQSKNAKK